LEKLKSSMLSLFLFLIDKTMSRRSFAPHSPKLNYCLLIFMSG
jgi:hypothetical protein